MSTLGLYSPGNSLLHRLPAGIKLTGMVLAGVVSVFLNSPPQVAVALLAVALAYVAARIPLRLALAQLRPLMWLAVAIGLFHILVNGARQAFVVVGVIAALVMLAALVTLTTRTADLVDAAVAACRPLRWCGVNPERVGLAFALCIRSVPIVIGLAEEVREAQRARGLTASPRTFAVTLIVRSLRHADQLGEALVARGIDDR